MRQVASILALMCFGILLSGCVPSLHPLYTPADVVTDDNLVGDWWQQHKTFLDLAPDERQMGKSLSVMYRMTLFPTHLFFFVRQVSPVLEIAALNPDWFRHFVKQHPDAIAFTEQERDPNMLLILSPTKDLQQFVLGHMEAFSDFSNMVKRPPAPMVQPTSTNGDIPWSSPKEWEKIKPRTKQ